ncbi:MAG: TetR-like C-terminal domain-containing protein, partial [Betaproteobacteria bacterium]
AEEGFEQLAERLTVNQGREMGAAYVRFALEHPQRFRLMFGGMQLLDGHFSHAARRDPAAFVDQVLGSVRFASTRAQRSA